jgi:hypothetical protein
MPTSWTSAPPLNDEVWGGERLPEGPVHSRTMLPVMPILCAHSRRHLRMFGFQVVSLVLGSSPALLIDDHTPVLFLLLLRRLCGVTAVFLLIVGLFSKRLTAGAGFGPLDHCLAFVLLQLGCSITLTRTGTQRATCEHSL